MRAIVDKVVPWLRTAANVATELAQSLPGKEATPVQKLMAYVSSAERVHRALAGGRDPTAEYAARYSLVREHSEPFVSLFFDSGMAEGFEVRRFELSNHEEGIEAKGTNGRFLFVASQWGEGRPRPTFYRSKELDARSIVDSVWAAREGRIGAEVQSLDYGETKTSFYTFPEPRGRLFGKDAEKRLAWLVARHRRFQADSIPRAYCFYGPPGTGKTTFADRFATELGTRVLRIDAAAFVNLTSQNVSFLVQMLEPDFLIVDDADKAEGATSRMLSLLERFKAENPKTTFAMTANATDGFDRGFLRPDRVDEWVRFDLPTEDERYEVISRYLENAMMHPGNEALRAISKEAEGLSHDYMREFAQLAQRAPLEEVLESVRQKKALLVTEKDDEKGPTSQPSSPKAIEKGAPLP